MHTVKLVILGRDGILNEYRDDHVKSPQEWVTVPGAMEAVSRLNHAGWHTVVATNQAGIGSGMIDMASINAVHAEMHRRLMAQGARVDAVFFCPHTADAKCECRKPQPAMLLEAARRFGADLATVPCIGDSLRDLEAAEAAGGQPMLVLTGKGEKTLREGGFPASTAICPDRSFAASALLARD